MVALGSVLGLLVGSATQSGKSGTSKELSIVHHYYFELREVLERKRLWALEKSSVRDKHQFIGLF